MESNSGASCPVTLNTAMHRVGAALALTTCAGRATECEVIQSEQRCSEGPDLR
jgi:hypothetical protein